MIPECLPVKKPPAPEVLQKDINLRNTRFGISNLDMNSSLAVSINFDNAQQAFFDSWQNKDINLSTSTANFSNTTNDPNDNLLEYTTMNIPLSQRNGNSWKIIEKFSEMGI